MKMNTMGFIKVVQQPQERGEIIIQSKVWDHYQPVPVSLLVIDHTWFPPLAVAGLYNTRLPLPKPHI